MLLPALHNHDTSAFSWPAALFLWGRGSRSDLHRHHSVELVMALSGTLRFREHARGAWTTCGAVLIRPDAAHEVDARHTDVLIGFVDAESDLGAALLERTRSNLTPLRSQTVAQWRSQLGSMTLTASCVEQDTGTCASAHAPRCRRSQNQACVAVAALEAGWCRGDPSRFGRRQRWAFAVAIPASLHRISRHSAATVCPLAAFAMRGP